MSGSRSNARTRGLACGLVTAIAASLAGGAAAAPAPARPRPPVDSDGDRVVDSRDRCPYAPGLLLYGGCPEPDVDGDGFLEREDRCPELPGVRPDGCPIPDRDGDGVLDPDDACPTEPGELADGCPMRDRDDDRVLDPDDRCPDAAETRNGFEDGDGCPDAIPADLAAQSGVVRGIYFDPNKDTLKAKSRPVLDRLVAILAKYPSVRIELAGHTDSTIGAYNRSDLSGRRAASVKRYLVDHGIAEVRIETRGAGPDEPIDTNKTTAGRARNRRIEVQLLIE